MIGARRVRTKAGSVFLLDAKCINVQRPGTKLTWLSSLATAAG